MTLKEYIEGYIQKNKLSNREFARLSGINHQAVSNIINRDDYRPDVVTLDRIAEYTGISIITLLKMVYPETFKDDDTLTPESELVAQAFENAPESVKDLVRRLIGLN